MNITVRFFAMFREQLGTGERTIALPAGATAREGFDTALTDAPSLQRLADTVMLMVNQEYADPDHVLQDGDELAVIPPVSGGDHAKRFAVTEQELDPRAVEALVAGPGEGAIVTFIGTVRNHARGRTVTLLEYEAYEAAAEKMLARVGAEACERWPDVTMAITHRTGALKPGEASVVIGCASPHRDAAYQASTFAISRIKEIVPIWKKEHYEDGSTWVGSETEYQRLTGRL
ncbi:MAG TPA: molybdopterin converting factor subunit 1 [Thermomicrobiales bacterium]|nr:molybdopterin converting factor subunit 1 [Thermomicrobiales bacterium]